MKSILKVKIEGTIENKTCLSTWVDPKQNKKTKINSKIKSKSKVIIEGSTEIKRNQLLE